MEEREELLQKLSEKKEIINNDTNELLGLYRNILEEKINYKKDNKYDKKIAEKRNEIKNLEIEVKDIEKQLKNSGVSNVKAQLKKYIKDNK